MLYISLEILIQQNRIYLLFNFACLKTNISEFKCIFSEIFSTTTDHLLTIIPFRASNKVISGFFEMLAGFCHLWLMVCGQNYICQQESFYFFDFNSPGEILGVSDFTFYTE